MAVGSIAPNRIAAVLNRHVAQLLKKCFQLVATAVEISDDVKRPVIVPLVVPKWSPLDCGRLHLLRRVEEENVREALSLQPPHRPSQLRFLLANNMRPEIPILSAMVPLLADLLGQVEHQSDRKAVVFPSELHERLASFGLDIGGVHHRQFPQGKSLAGYVVQKFERLVRGRLIIFVVRDHSSACVRR